MYKWEIALGGFSKTLVEVYGLRRKTFFFPFSIFNNYRTMWISVAKYCLKVNVFLRSTGITRKVSNGLEKAYYYLFLGRIKNVSLNGPKETSSQYLKFFCRGFITIFTPLFRTLSRLTHSDCIRATLALMQIEWVDGD